MSSEGSSSSAQGTPQKKIILSETSILYVARGIVLTSLSFAGITSTWALLRGRGTNTAKRFALSSAYNGAIVSSTFFAIKHFVALPASALIYEAKEEELSTSAAQPLSWAGIRTRELPETALSGALAGAIHHSIRHTGARIGMRNAPRTMLIGTVFCSAIQLLYNEAEVQRIKYISRLRERRNIPVPEPPEPKPKEAKEPFGRTLLRWLGVKPASKEDLLEKLKKERDLVWNEIQRLEQAEVRAKGEER